VSNSELKRDKNNETHRDRARKALEIKLRWWCLVSINTGKPMNLLLSELKLNAEAASKAPAKVGVTKSIS